MENSNKYIKSLTRADRIKALSYTTIISVLVLLPTIFFGFKVPFPPRTETPVFIEIETPDPPIELGEGGAQEAALGETDYGAPGTNTGTPARTPQNLQSTTTDPGGSPQMNNSMSQDIEQTNVAANQSGNTNNQNTTPPRQPNPMFSYSRSNNPNPGQGTGTTPGYQGSLTGNPNSTNYNSIGEKDGPQILGLGNRQLKKPPEIDYSVQKNERVVVEIVVNRSGQVVRATQTIKYGATLTTGPLVEKVLASVKQIQFTEDQSAFVEQFGTIIFNFKVQ